MEGLNLIAHNDLKNPATEAYRVIRTSIQFAQAGKELKTLAVTSCTPNEGKSMTVANLAVVLTQAGKSVLLLDCDMRNPTVHKNFGLSNKLGLSSCIRMRRSRRSSLKASLMAMLAKSGGYRHSHASAALTSGWASTSSSVRPKRAKSWSNSASV